MRANPNLLLFVILLMVSSVLAQTVPEGFSTFPVEATIDNSTAVTSEVGSALAGDNSVHVAYISRPDGAAPQLKYFRYKDNAISNHVAIDLPGTPGQILGPVVALDQSSNPHIVVMVKRVAGSNIKSGNYAVYYAGSTTGGSSFTVSQVSTNPTDPNTDDENVFNCWVNGRPKIRMIDSVPWVYYFSDYEASKNYAILAKKNGSTWERFQEFTFNQTDFNDPSIDFDAHFIHTDLGEIFGWNDIGDYTPKYAIKSGGSWQVTNMTEYNGTFGTRSVTMSTTSDGEKHMMFMNEVTDEKFIHIKINGVGDYQEVNRLVLDFSKAGNIFPSTIDPVTKVPYFFGKKSFSDSGFLLTVDSDGQQVSNEFIKVGNAAGVYTLHASNGYVSLVTADFDGNKIYVSTGSIGGGSTMLTSDFTATPTSVAPGDEVSFSFTGTGTPTTYAWTFEGGTPATSDSATPAVTYAAEGEYEVTLEVTGEGGATDTETKAAYIKVAEGGLKASFTADNQNIAPGDVVKFTDTSTGSPTVWNWTFSGGTPSTSTLQHPEVKYNAVGEYDVQLIVALGEEKDTLLAAKYIVVLEGGGDPGADVTAITEAWANRIPALSNDEIVDVAVDAGGTVYVAGFASRVVDGKSASDVIAVSADRNGSEKYNEKIVNNGGVSYPEDEPWGITADANGNTYIAAGLERQAGGSIPREYHMISLDNAGAERWRIVNTTYNYSQYMTAWDDKLAVLTNGDATSGSTDIAHNVVYSTANGAEVSKTTVDLGQGNIAIGRYYDMYGYYDTERRLLQSEGDVIYGVTHAGTGANGRDIHLRKVSSAGQLFTAIVDSEPSMSQDELTSLLVDADKNIYVLANLANAEKSGIMSLIKYNPQLTKIWQADVVPEGSSMSATSMSFDSEGNIIVSGFETYPRLAKISADGVLLWEKWYKELEVGFWKQYSVFVAPSDKMVLAGRGTVVASPMAFILLDKEGNVVETFQDEDNATYENFINKAVYVPQENAVYVGGWSRDDNSERHLYYGKYLFPLKTEQTITFDELADVAQTISQITLSAVSSSGLTVAFEVEGPATITGNILKITGPGLVSVTAKQAGSSSYTAASVTQSFCVIASKPSIGSDEQSDGVLLTSSAVSGNQWYKDGAPIDGANQKTHLAISSGDYQVRVLIDGCEGELSDIKAVEVSPVLGLPNVAENPKIKVYPNPVSERLVVEAGAITIRSVGVYAISGSNLHNIPMTKPYGGKIEINTENLPSGMYVLKIASSEGDYALRIVRE